MKKCLAFMLVGFGVVSMVGGCIDEGDGSAAADGSSPNADVATDSGGDTNAGGPDASSSADAGTDTAGVSPDGSPTADNGGQPGGGCMADHFLDLSGQAGAGPGYDPATVTATCTDTVMVVSSNGMPHYTFVSVTPNPLTPVAFNAELPLNPQVAPQTTEVALLGTIGVAVNGAVFFGPNEGQMPDPFGDPQLNAITDACWGHTANAYHYHALRDECLGPDSLVAEPWTNPAPDPTKPSPVLGFALDGFPVYGPYGCLDADCTQVAKMKSSWEATGYEKIGCASDADCGNGFQCGKAIVDGQEVQICGSETYAWDHNTCTKATCAEASGEWLDECNGRIGPDGTYRYHATDTFPYILGCYRGTPVTVNGGGGGQPPGGGGAGAGPPDCTTDADCVDACPEGSMDCGCVTLQGGPFAGQDKCVPLCNTSADCPQTPDGGAMNCSPQGRCVPAGPGG